MVNINIYYNYVITACNNSTTFFLISELEKFREIKQTRKMKFKSLIIQILYGISLAMVISILFLSYLMDFSCSVNIKFLVIYISIAILCLTCSGIISILNK